MRGSGVKGKHNMENEIFYSVIVVCLNAGERLIETVESVLAQDYGNFEIVVKDGGSADESLERLRTWGADKDNFEKVHIFGEQDAGIYDAMNQAVALAKGMYYVFLNAGDSFYNTRVLRKITDGILKERERNGQMPDIVYGDLYHKALGTAIRSAPEINDFTCYRNVPCHQVCFYHQTMFRERAYNPKYTVRADYEHFLWCYYVKKAVICYLPMLAASYEGGGYSETKENRKRSAKQHREIVLQYMGRKKADKYRLIMLLSLAPLRSALADSKAFSGLYNKVKTTIYQLRKKGG